MDFRRQSLLGLQRWINGHREVNARVAEVFDKAGHLSDVDYVFEEDAEFAKLTRVYVAGGLFTSRAHVANVGKTPYHRVLYFVGALMSCFDVCASTVAHSLLYLCAAKKLKLELPKGHSGDETLPDDDKLFTNLCNCHPEPLPGMFAHSHASLITHRAVFW
jgi:hypothetical protein